MVPEKYFVKGTLILLVIQKCILSKDYCNVRKKIFKQIVAFRQIFSKINFDENDLNYFEIALSLIRNCLLLRDISFYVKCSLWLTSNHIFGSGNFCDKSPSRYLKILNFPNFQKCTRAIYPKWPSQTCDY